MVEVVSKVTTPLLTVRSMSAESRRSSGFAETATLTLASVRRSENFREFRSSMARRMNLIQRRRSSRLAHAAEATAVIQMGRTRREIILGIINLRYTPV